MGKGKYIIFQSGKTQGNLNRAALFRKTGPHWFDRCIRIEPYEQQPADTGGAGVWYGGWNTLQLRWWLDDWKACAQNTVKSLDNSWELEADSCLLAPICTRSVTESEILQMMLKTKTVSQGTGRNHITFLRGATAVGTEEVDLKPSLDPRFRR